MGGPRQTNERTNEFAHSERTSEPKRERASGATGGGRKDCEAKDGRCTFAETKLFVLSMKQAVESSRRAEGGRKAQSPEWPPKAAQLSIPVAMITGNK